MMSAAGSDSRRATHVEGAAEMSSCTTGNGDRRNESVDQVSLP